MRQGCHRRHPRAAAARVRTVCQRGVRHVRHGFPCRRPGRRTPSRSSTPPYRGLGDGNYQGYQAGSRHIRIFLDPSPREHDRRRSIRSSSPPSWSTRRSRLTAGTYYTLLHVGSARAGAAVKEKLWIITDALPTQSTATVQYRIINTATVQGAVDVYVSATGTTALPARRRLRRSRSSPRRRTSRRRRARIVMTTDPARHADGGWCGDGYTLQTGTAGTTAADPIYGSGQGGSIFTAFIFDATPAGTTARDLLDTRHRVSSRTCSLRARPARKDSPLG